MIISSSIPLRVICILIHTPLSSMSTEECQVLLPPEVVELLGLISTLALAITKTVGAKRIDLHKTLCVDFNLCYSILAKLLRVTWCLCLNPTEPEQLEISTQLSLFCLSASERHDSNLTSANQGSVVLELQTVVLIIDLYAFSAGASGIHFDVITNSPPQHQQHVPSALS